MLRAMGNRYGDDEPERELDVSVPVDVSQAPEDSLGHEAPPPRPGLVRALVGAGVLAVVASLVVTVVLPQRRATEQRHQRAAYDQLLALSADGEASIERAVSGTHDVVQYAEPLLNSAQTTPETRADLFRQINEAARRSRATIDAERARLTADKTTRSGRLKVAREATLTYLTSWSALFGHADGGGAVAPNDDLHAQQQAARAALLAAAPDAVRAAKAAVVLGTDDV